jgi:diguanylate cyclase (GGDEF)-like protein
LDLDNLKVVNDTLGHSAGDALLKSTAEVISHCLREFDTVARLGGDEFGILVEELTDRADALGLADRLLTAVRQPVSVGDRTVSATVSIGICFDAPGITGDQLLRRADRAMYGTKDGGGDGWTEFDEAMPAALSATM